MAREILDRRYLVLEKIGAGSMGEVFKARDLKNGRIIALKVLSRQKTSTDTVRRFQREFTILAAMHHPNLCPVYDFGMLKDGRSYFTMEYIDGPDIYRATRGMVREKVYGLIVQLCRALEYVHTKGMIHYDIKPVNVLIQPANRNHDRAVVKLTDFGLAGEQRTRAGLLIKGTFPYIAPEVIRGRPVDHRADLYALGVLMYEILTRRRFRTSSRRRGDPDQPPFHPRPSLDQNPVLSRLLADDPEQRFNRANEVIAAINRLCGLRFKTETAKTIEGYLIGSRFVGRDKEMKLLRSLYAMAHRGEGKVILINGEAGIGKSRLINEFRTYVQLEHGYCTIGRAGKTRTQHLEPFAGIFKDLLHYLDLSRLPKDLGIHLAVLGKVFPDLTEIHLGRRLPVLIDLEPEKERLRIFEALRVLLDYAVSELGTLVIVVEDLHWVDESSIRILEYLARGLRNKNILICATMRSKDLLVNHRLEKMVANIRKSGNLMMIKLGPLRLKSLYTYLDSTITPRLNSPRLARYLLEKTGGNPFFVEEIIRKTFIDHGIAIGDRLDIDEIKRQSIPSKIEELVDRRIEDLDPDGLVIVHYASLILGDFNFDTMSRLTGFDDTRLSQAIWQLRKRQILIEEGNRYHFYHSILREVVEQQFSEDEKKKINLEIGRVIEQIHRKKLDRVIEGLAYYYINGRHRSKGVSFGLRAARENTKRFAYEEAARLYRGVLDLLDNSEISRRFTILQELAAVERNLNYYQDAIGHYQHSIRMKIGDKTKKVRAITSLASIYLRTGQYADALKIYHRAARILKGLPPSLSKSLLGLYIKVVRQGIRSQIGEYARLESLHLDLQRSWSGLKSYDDIRMLVDIYHNLGAIELNKGLRSRMDYDRAIYYYKKVYKYSQRINALDKIPSVLNNLGICYYQKFDYANALRCYEQAIHRSKRLGDQYDILFSLMNIGIILWDQGNYQPAMERFQSGLDIARKINNPSMIGASQLGLGACSLEQCNYSRARDYCERALKIFRTIGWKGEEGFLIGSLGNIRLASGDYESALRYYRRALKISRRLGFNRQIASLLIYLGAVHFGIGDLVKTQKYVEESLEIGKEFGFLDIKIACFIWLGRIHLMRRAYRTAHRFCEKALLLIKRLKLQRQLIETCLVKAEINRRTGDYKQGVKIATRALVLAKIIDKKDLYATGLLVKSQNEMELKRSERRILRQLNEAQIIAEEIGAPEICWKVHYEIGNVLREQRPRKALEHYLQCIAILKAITARLPRESHRRAYLNRADRKLAVTIIDQISISP